MIWKGLLKVNIVPTGKEEMLRLELPHNSCCLEGSKVVPVDMIYLSKC